MFEFMNLPLQLSYQIRRGRHGIGIQKLSQIFWNKYHWSKLLTRLKCNTQVLNATKKPLAKFSPVPWSTDINEIVITRGYDPVSWTIRWKCCIASTKVLVLTSANFNMSVKLLEKVVIGDTKNILTAFHSLAWSWILFWRCYRTTITGQRGLFFFLKESKFVIDFRL